MEKALNVMYALREAVSLSKNYPSDEILDEAIAELEEAMKPKTCLGCLHCNKAYQLTSFPPQYKLNCGVFKTVFVNDFKQYCSRYEPKDNA